MATCSEDLEMFIPVIKVQINDRTPSANGVKPIVRSVLWGIVETVVNIDDLNESSSREKSTESFSFSVSVDSDDASASQAKRVYDANYLSASEFTLKSLFQEEIQDSLLKGFIGNIYDVDFDMQLPLSFGKRSKNSKNKKNKKKKNYPTRYGNEPSFECPAGFIWNFNLPTPPKRYMEENVCYLRSTGLGVPPTSYYTPTSPPKPIEDQSTDSCDALRVVRILGYGPTLVKEDPHVGRSLRPGSAGNTESEHVTVEVVSYSGHVEERLTVPRKHLQQMKEETLVDLIGIINAAVYNRPEDDNTHKGVEDKYWDQRYRLFSLYDRGVQMDSESWFSVTPECISEQIADRCLEGAVRSYGRAAQPNPTESIGKNSKKKLKKEMVNRMKNAEHIRVGRMLDLFCGCGGNSIPLARVCHHLVAVDINPAKLVDASANAKIYGLEEKIDFVCADAYDILKSLETDDASVDTYSNTGVDIVLLAPPWGGPSYCLSKSFDMYTDFPSGNGLELVVKAARVSKNIVCVYPRNIMMQQVMEIAQAIDSPCRIEEIYLYSKHKLSILYFGTMFNDV